MRNRVHIIKAVLFSSFILYLTCELGLRVHMFITKDVVVTSTHNIMKSHYPVMSKADEYLYDENRINLLVLGGSVVFQDTITFEVNSETYKFGFCGYTDIDTSTFNILNLSYPAHTTLDSKFKYALVQDLKFDYVFVYHGINDTRSNNIEHGAYKSDYSHIEYYDDLNIVLNHPNSKLTVVPYYLEVFWKGVKKRFNLTKYIPREFLSFLYGNDSETANAYFNFPCNSYTKTSFYRNLNQLILSITSNNAQPILSTYANYQPNNYSYELFVTGELDYNNQLFPTELYGNPSCIPSLINTHNGKVKILARKYRSGVIFVPLEEVIPKNKRYYEDICHLTQIGCHAMYEEVLKLLK